MFSDPEFWVLVAFVIFIVLVAGKAYSAVSAKLDERASKIASELDEAAKLREEAAALLASYQRNQRDAAQEAESIVQQARDEAERLRIESETELESVLDRRSKLAVAKIEQAEVQAAKDVREFAIEVATNASRTLLAESLDSERSNELINRAIDEADRKLS